MSEGYEYTGYFNDEAYGVLEWACQEFVNGNRIKASKIKRAAERMEYNYRKKNNYPMKENVIVGRYMGSYARDARLAWIRAKKEEGVQE